MAAVAPARPQRAPRRPAETRRPRLAVLGARELAARTARRRARTLIALAAALVAGALLIVASTQAVVDSQQLRIDTEQQQVANAANANGNLQLQRADLDSPARVLQIAQHKLGMVSPATVTYLAPVRLGPTVGSAAQPGES